MLFFVQAMVVFGSALVCHSFTVGRHHVVICNVVLPREFAPSLDYHTSIGKILDKIISLRCQPTCPTALLSVSHCS